MTGYSLFTPSFGFAQTVSHPLAHGSFVASCNIVLLMSLASQGGRVALLHLLKLVLQEASFEVLAIGLQAPLSDTYGKMWWCFMHLFLGAVCIILLLPDLFATYDHFSCHPVLLFALTFYIYLTFPSSSVLNFLLFSSFIIIFFFLKKKRKKSTILPLGSLLYSRYN
jgi:hypothetical protein